MKHRILFIDDEKHISDILKNNLNSNFNFEVTLKCLPSELFQELDANNYDAILLDYMIPIEDEFFTPEEIKRMDDGLSTGLVLIERIRSKHPTLPILIYSAKNNVKTDDYSYYLRKPELAKDIADKLKWLITKS